MVDLPKLESVAQQLVGRMHDDDDPVRTWAWLAAELPNPADWYRLCHVLACAVPTDKTWRELTAWAHGEPVENPVEHVDRHRDVYEAVVAERFGPRPGRRVA